MSVYSGLVEKAKAELGCPREIREGSSKLFCSVGAEGIGQGVVNLEVPNHKDRVEKHGKGSQRGHLNARFSLGLMIIQV